MKNNKALSALLLFTVTLGLLGSTGCKKDDKEPTLKATTYNLKVKDQLGISGTVTFTETSSTVTTVTIKLNNGSATNHPAHIHANSAIEGGSIILSLNPVDASGNSTTVVTKLDDNTAINYSQLLDLDGYLNVHESSANLGTIIAQTDIGGNEITTTQKSYTLATANASGVNGTALFEKRKNGKALVTVSLTGTLANNNYPANIRLGSVSTVGTTPVRRSLNDVDGASGKSYTNVRTLNDGTPVSYDEWLVFTGFIRVEDPVTSLPIAEGNIGN